MLGHPECEIGCHQRQRNFHARLTGPLPQSQAQPADGDAVKNFPDDDHRKGAARLRQRECAGCRRCNGESVENERCCVVREPFTFENHKKAPRQSEASSNGERRNRIGRSDDGSEQEADRPFELQNVMRDCGNSTGGENHAAERKQSYRPQVELEFAPAHSDPCRVEEWRQDHQEHQLRGKRDCRKPRDQGHSDTGNHQNNGRRGLEPLRKNSRGGEDRQHQQKSFHGPGHGLAQPGLIRLETMFTVNARTETLKKNDRTP